MKELSEIREEIDALDDEIARLLVRRQGLVAEVADAKRSTGKAVSDPDRERQILDRVAAEAGRDGADGVRRVFSTLFEISKARQRSLLRPPSVADRTVAVVGLGLIGGSFYKASLRAGYRTVGLHHGESAGLADADFVFVCLPPEAIVPWIRARADDFRPGATVVDICGVKRPIVRDMESVPRHGWHFVGGHPMAGREVSGYRNSLADLFVGASMILTPGADVPPNVIDALKAFFTSLGFSRTILTTPERHDEMIAFTSQLCHVIATAYARDPRTAESAGFSAGSFANMTRVATQDPAVWSALYRFDREALLKVLGGFIDRLNEFREALSADDAARLRALIADGSSRLGRAN